MMSLLLILVFAPIALSGHLLLWVSLWNFVQGMPRPSWINHGWSHLTRTFALVLPGVIVISLVFSDQTSPWKMGAMGYSLACILIAIAGIPCLLGARQRSGPAQTKSLLKTLSSFHQTYLGSREESLESADFSSRWMLNAPGNLAFDIENNEKFIEVPRLDRSLNGLTIAHISDLHLNGRIAKSFFDHAIDMVNDMDADLVAVTGNLVNRQEFMSWIPVTLGRLESKHGVYVILGKDDSCQPLSQLRLMLQEAGLTTLSGRVERIPIGKRSVLLAGNELPWIVPAADMSAAPSRSNEELRILLANSVDQISWARHFDFDLMLSGNDQCGRCSLPWLGAIGGMDRIALPLTHGIAFHHPTLLHVSRGLSSPVPLRWDGRPEITKLVLGCPNDSPKEQAAENRRETPKEVAAILSTIKHPAWQGQIHSPAT